MGLFFDTANTGAETVERFKAKYPELGLMGMDMLVIEGVYASQAIWALATEPVQLMVALTA